MSKIAGPLAVLPSVSSLLQTEAVHSVQDKWERNIIVDALRNVLEDCRKTISGTDAEKISSICLEPEMIAREAVNRLMVKYEPRIRRAVNATGIILHTGLGRAPLSKEALCAIQDTAGRYSTVEIDIESGMRGSRYDLVEGLICSLTGAEGAIVVNNNAAAVFLTLNTIAFGGEVIISRGQLIEIGGSFRMPDIMHSSGARMVEVGTTNKTYLSDYSQAITEDTVALMKANTSNYKIIGFTESVQLQKLVNLGKEYGIPIIEDNGSGSIVDFQEFGFPYEPYVQESITAGADVVTFSGDKILGGPQAGIIVGKKNWIDKIKKNPIARVVRCDKLVFAALESTLKLFLNPSRLTEIHPVMYFLSRTPESLTEDIKKCVRLLNNNFMNNCDYEILEDYSQLGSGSLPAENIHTMVLALYPKKYSVEKLASNLRKSKPPIIPRIAQDRVLLDFRTIFEDEIEIVAKTLNTIFNILSDK